MTKPNLPAVIQKERFSDKILFIAAVIVIFVALAAAALTGRAIVTAVNTRDVPAWDGLLFVNVKSELKYDSGAMKLLVDGIIYNQAEKKKVIPDIRAKALGPDRRTIQSWQVEAPVAEVGPGAKVPFHTEVITSMEHTIKDVNLEFVARKASDARQAASP